MNKKLNQLKGGKAKVKNIVLTLTAICMVSLLASSVLATNLISANAIFSASSDSPVKQKVALNDAILIEDSDEDLRQIPNPVEDSDLTIPSDESDNSFTNRALDRVSYYPTLSDITDLKGASYTVKEAIVNGNIFSVDVSFNGCEDDQFKILISEESTLDNTDPDFLRRDAKIIREKSSCTDTKQISRTEEFDISRLISKYESSTDMKKKHLLILRNYEDQVYLSVYASEVPKGIFHRSAFPEWAEEYKVGSEEDDANLPAFSTDANAPNALAPNRVSSAGGAGFSANRERVAGEPDYNNEEGYYIPGAEKSQPGHTTDQTVAIRPTKITSAKIFGFIPIPWKKAVEVQIIKGEVITEITISEDSETAIAGYDVSIGKIVSEDEVEFSIEKSTTPTDFTQSAKPAVVKEIEISRG